MSFTYPIRTYDSYSSLPLHQEVDQSLSSCSSSIDQVSFLRLLSTVKIETSYKDFLEKNKCLFTQLAYTILRTFLQYPQKKKRPSMPLEYAKLSRDFLLGFQTLPQDCQAFLLEQEEARQFFFRTIFSYDFETQSLAITILSELVETFPSCVLQVLSYQEENKNFGLSLSERATKKEIHREYVNLLLLLARSEVDKQALFQLINFQCDQTEERAHYGIFLAEMKDVPLLTQYFDLLVALRKDGSISSEDIQRLLEQPGFLYTDCESCCSYFSSSPQKLTLLKKIDSYPEKEELLAKIDNLLSQEVVKRVELATQKKTKYFPLPKNTLFIGNEPKTTFFEQLLEDLSSGNYQSAISHINGNAYLEEIVQLYPFFNVRDQNGLTVKLLVLSLLAYPDLSSSIIPTAKEIVVKSATCKELFPSKKFAEFILKETEDPIPTRENPMLQQRESKKEIAPPIICEFAAQISLDNQLKKANKEKSAKEYSSYMKERQKKPLRWE